MKTIENPQVIQLQTPVPSGKILADVEGYINDDVIHRFKTKLDLTQVEAEQLFLDTKRFLYICASHSDKGPFSPTEIIDKGWHEFLMFTFSYQQFCTEFLGKFVHHWPFTPSVKVLPGGVHRSYCVAVEVFGADLSENWSISHNDISMSNCGCDGSCGGGCNG
ncbi:MAG: hypothetical protein V4689_05390 [Verrucomicrobiota bacterium]